jgi:hypothetical protein
MDSNPLETRPLKRRRIEMGPPDGFTAAATARKPVYKPVVPQFSSAFNHPKASSSDKESTDNLKERWPVLSIVEGADRLKERRSIHLKTDAPILQLRPPPKPPVPSYLTTSVPLKPAVPPLPLLANKHSSKDLKSLQPPPVPLPSNPVIDGKNLRTISKTRVALATDLSTDSGVAELASIFLHDQHPDIALQHSHDHRDGRGLGLSPKKKGKGKGFKFVRYVLFSHCLGITFNPCAFNHQRWSGSQCIYIFRTVSNLSRLMAKRNGTSSPHSLILRFTCKHHQDPTKPASESLTYKKINFSRDSSLSNSARDK